MRRRFMNSKSFDENNYLTFVCLEDNSTIMFTKEIYYSINGSVWNKLYLNTPLKVTVGMHISFKENFREIDTIYGIGYFITEGKFNILGNVNSLIFGDNAKNQTDISSYEDVFRNLFIRNTSIIDASLLKLPATTLANSCYSNMFRSCTNLTTAPTILPATTLASNCYEYMFYDCTNLKTAPELPATTLASNCYEYMFYNCTNLTTAPVLPATTLANYCYDKMFQNCTSLTTAPVLPATTLKFCCYRAMFEACTKLSYIKMLATDISESNCLNNWVYGVATTGTFVKNPDMNSLPTGNSGIPSGWTVEDYVESISLCDVAYWDGSTVKTCSYNKYNTALGTAIGVVVIPEGFAPDGKARIVGLKPMDASGNMTDSHTLMTWGGSSVGFYTDTTLTNYTVLPITDNVGSTSSGSNHVGRLPSDKFTGTQSYVDPEAKYNYDDYLIPSPYLGDAPNPEYYKTISGNNVLSDFNGLTNTQTLVGLGSSNYQAANACWNYTDGTSSNVQWYLPAMGELGYLIVRLKAINEVITSLGGVAVDSNSYFWSSSEYSATRVWAAHFPDGGPSSYTKSMSGYMYAFATIDNGSTNLITFTVNGIEYQAEEGMTWEEWINSSYYDQNLNITIKTNDRLYIDGDPILRNSLQGAIAQYTNTEIVVNGIYNSM